QPQAGVSEIADLDERQAVTGRSDDEIERSDAVRVLEQFDERRWLRERFDSRQRPIEKHVTVVEPAQVDAYRAGVDADHARHGQPRGGDSERATSRIAS